MKEERKYVKIAYTLTSMLPLFLISFAFNVDSSFGQSFNEPYQVSSWLWLATTVLSILACFSSHLFLKPIQPCRAVVEKYSNENGKGVEFLLTFIIPLVQGRADTWNQFAISISLMILLFIAIFCGRLYILSSVIIGRKLYHVDVSLLNDKNQKITGSFSFHVSLRGKISKGSIIHLESKSVSDGQFASIEGEYDERERD